MPIIRVMTINIIQGSRILINSEINLHHFETMFNFEILDSSILLNFCVLNATFFVYKCKTEF